MRKRSWYNPTAKTWEKGVSCWTSSCVSKSINWSSSVVEPVVEDGIGARVVVVF